MSATSSFLGTLAELTQRAAPLLWAISWQVSVLVGLVGLMALLCRRASAAFRYGLWCIVLLRLCLPLSLTLPLGLAQWTRQLAQMVVVWPPAPAVVRPVTEAPAQSSPFDPLLTVHSSVPATPSSKLAPQSRPDFNLFVLGWGVIAAALGLTLVWRTRRVHRLVRQLPRI